MDEEETVRVYIFRRTLRILFEHDKGKDINQPLTDCWLYIISISITFSSTFSDPLLIWVGIDGDEKERKWEWGILFSWTVTHEQGRSRIRVKRWKKRKKMKMKMEDKPDWISTFSPPSITVHVYILTIGKGDKIQQRRLNKSLISYYGFTSLIIYILMLIHIFIVI